LPATPFTTTSRSLARTLLATVAAASLLAAGSASSANADDACVNAAQRTQSSSTGLPECRAYEMVSPPYKEGFPVEPTGTLITDDGLLSFQTTGSFAGNAQGTPGNRYYATRSSTGWIATAPAPPDTMYNTFGNGVQIQSPDLRRSLWEMSRRDQPGDKLGYYLRGPDGVFTRVGDVADSSGSGSPFVTGVSDDLSHIVFNYGVAGSAPLTVLREFVGTGNQGDPRLVSVDNNDDVTLPETCFNAISADGRVVVFTSGCHIGTTQLWARVGGTTTIAVSRSECTRTAADAAGACNGASAADYVGASADGSRVFFTTSQQLVNSDTDTTEDLYVCDIASGVPAPVGSANPCATLTRVSGAASNARVENAVAVSDDGSRVYFVAQGVLAGNLGVGDAGPATPGPGVDPLSIHNLYLWERDAAHPAGHTIFVATLSNNDLTQAQMTPDGRYLLFATANPLVTTGPSADNTDGARDVYRYDTNTASIVRVSTSTLGGGGNSGFDASPGVNVDSITSDGATVIFDSDEALSPLDTDGVTDVYAWHDGQVSLISSGGGRGVGISPSGRDIFFTTDAPVLAADGDVITDIYDARVGGGFDRPQTAPPCFGDGCLGERSSPPNLSGGPVQGSGLPDVVSTAPAFSLRAVSAAQRKTLAATGRLALTVTTNAPGTISASGAATFGGRSVVVASARRAVAAPGRATVSLTLSKRARAQLAARGKLTVKIAVSHSKVALDRSVTLKLVHAKAKKRSLTHTSAQRTVVSVNGSRS
jgi:hypothetical protein